MCVAQREIEGRLAIEELGSEVREPGVLASQHRAVCHTARLLSVTLVKQTVERGMATTSKAFLGLSQSSELNYVSRKQVNSDTGVCSDFRNQGLSRWAVSKASTRYHPVAYAY